MRQDTVAVNVTLVNRERLQRGLGRMDFYRSVGCDPRTGSRALNGGRVPVSVVRRFAKALGLPVRKTIDLDAIAEPVSQAKNA